MLSSIGYLAPCPNLAPIEIDADTIVVVSPNVSCQMGGEALKVHQFAGWLQNAGAPVQVVTHARCRAELLQAFSADVLHFIEDDAAQLAMWRSRLLRPLLTSYFHRQARRVIERAFPNRERTILHYVCPISPLEPRLAPPGYSVVIGPLNGNIGYPPGLRHRATRAERVHAASYSTASRLMAPLLRRERDGAAILVSGGRRTVEVLAGRDGSPPDFVEVLDAGVDDVERRGPHRHRGFNGRFYTCSRLVGWKGVDLAIQAVARCGPEFELSVIGEGPYRGTLEEIVRTLDARDRVRFRGWIDHGALSRELRTYRGFVFPSMCEANGIAMQEAMMSGVPVVALRWGGPAMLANDDSAILVDPSSGEAVVAALAEAMIRLAHDSAFADRLAANARIRAADFAWDRVAQSWIAAYPQRQNHRRPS
jgi:glycosyltransferase involved in cell wall biosynthesis